MKAICTCLVAAAVVCISNHAGAVPFLTEDFEYADGDLTTVSGGLWTTHSGGANAKMQVLDEQAVVVTGRGGASGGFLDEDVNRSIGATLSPGNTWYYAARITVEDIRVDPAGSVFSEYFMHFKDSSTFNFRGRLWVSSVEDSSKFTLGISSSSANFADVPKWSSDLTFGETYTIVVSYTASENDPRPFLDPEMTVPNPDFSPLEGEDGWASLWVNPVDASSQKLTDMAPPTNVGTDLLSGMEAIALRQGGSGNGTRATETHVDTLAVGNDFDEVLAAVGGSPTPTDNADFDNDGDVDGRDLLVWQRNLGATGGAATLANGNANGDSVIDAVDLDVWRQQFSAGAAAPSIGAIPEPASAVLLVAGALAMATVRRRG